MDEFELRRLGTCPFEGCMLAAGHHPAFHGPLVSPPDDTGHTWRIAVSCRGAYKVVGEVGQHDADVFEPLEVVEVRASSLVRALDKAASLPLTAWFPVEAE